MQWMKSRRQLKSRWMRQLLAEVLRLTMIDAGSELDDGCLVAPSAGDAVRWGPACSAATSNRWSKGLKSFDNILDFCCMMNVLRSS